MTLKPLLFLVSGSPLASGRKFLPSPHLPSQPRNPRNQVKPGIFLWVAGGWDLLSVGVAQSWTCVFRDTRLRGLLRAPALREMTVLKETSGKRAGGPKGLAVPNTAQSFIP